MYRKNKRFVLGKCVAITIFPALLVLVLSVIFGGVFGLSSGIVAFVLVLSFACCMDQFFQKPKVQQISSQPQVRPISVPKPKIIESFESELVQINTTLAGSTVQDNSSSQRKLLKKKKEILEKLHTYYEHWQDHQHTNEIKEELDATDQILRLR